MLSNFSLRSTTRAYPTEHYSCGLITTTCSNKAFDFNSRLTKVNKEKRKVKNSNAKLFYSNKAFGFFTLHFSFFT